MKRFLGRLFLFLSLTIVLISIAIFLFNQFIINKNLPINQTEANLFYIKKNEKFQNVILGISHARNFSRGVHHQIFEKQKGKTINLGIGNSLCGLAIQNSYLEYFYEQKNKVDTVYLILSPTLMYNSKVDDTDIAFYAEPIKLKFIQKQLKEKRRYKYKQIFYYVKSKLSHHWWNPNLHLNMPIEKRLTKIDSNQLTKGLEIAYPYGLNENEFKICNYSLSKIIANTKRYGSFTKIIMPPALFGKWPGHDKIVWHIKNNYKDIEIIDLSESILNPNLYYDHHHLNTEGIKKLVSLM